MPGDLQVFKTGEFSTSLDKDRHQIVQSGQSLFEQRLSARQRNDI